MNIVWTWTEHNEHEHFVHVRVHHILEPNLNVQVQVRAQDPRTWTEPNRGQSTFLRFLVIFGVTTVTFRQIEDCNRFKRTNGPGPLNFFEKDRKRPWS